MALYPNVRRDIIGVMPTNIYGYLTMRFLGASPQKNTAYFGNSNIVTYSSIPENTIGTPSNILPPLDGGGMLIDGTGTGTLEADLLPTRVMDVDLTGTGDLDATGSLVVSLEAALTGSGSVSATITGLLDASVDLTGSGSLTAALTGIGSMLVDLTGTGDVDATIAAYGDMSIDIVVTGTGLTTANVAQVVWSALASANNEPGSMGELLNNSGAGANPWTVTLEGSYTAADLMRIMAAAMAGKTSGQPDAPVFRAVDDSEDRITATVDGDGNRTSVTVNP